MMLGSLFGKIHNVINPGSKQSPSPSKTVQVHAACEASQTGNQAQAEDTLTECADEHSCGFVYDAVMEMHLRETHAEHPYRVRELNSKLEREGLLAKCEKLVPKLASTKQLLKCHSQAHINKVEQLYKNPVNTQGEPAKQEGDTFIISSDIYCNKHTSIAARSAAGCSIQAVHAVLSGKVRSSFAIVRPPGHHAEADEVQGFCFYNNVAVAAHAALGHPGIERVLIVDWDIHHGNGTQKIFEDDGRVLFVSLHRRDKDFYPEGVGYAEEVGTGKGQGFNVNIPWACDGRAMLVGDADYLAAFDLILDPIITQFNPHIVLISAGFDAAQGDILGKCHVTPAGFAAMTQRLRRYADGKVVAVLEGGYVPSIVGECATAVLQVLQGEQPEPTNRNMHKSLSKVLSKVDAIQRQYWSGLAALPPFAARYKEYSNTAGMQAICTQTSSPCRATRASSRAAATGAGDSKQVESPISLAEAPGALKKAAAAKIRAEKRAAATAERKATAAAKATLSSHALPDVAAERAAVVELIGTAAADEMPAAAEDSAAAANSLADSLGSLSVSREPSRENSIAGQANRHEGSPEAESTPAAASETCIDGASVIIVAAGSCASVAPISAAPGAVRRAASLKAREEQRAKAVAERKALAERRAATQAAKLALLQAERKAEVAAARAAAKAAADAEEKAKAATGVVDAAAQEAAEPAITAPRQPANREDRVCAAALATQQPSSSISSTTEDSAARAQAVAVLTSAMPPTPTSAALAEEQPCTPIAAAALPADEVVLKEAPISASKTPSPVKDCSCPCTSSNCSEKPKPSSAAKSGTPCTRSMAATERAADSPDRYSPNSEDKLPHVASVKAGSPSQLSMAIKEAASGDSAGSLAHSTAKPCSPKALGMVARDAPCSGRNAGGSSRSPRSAVDSPIFRCAPTTHRSASKTSPAGTSVGKRTEKSVQPPAAAAVPCVPSNAVVVAAATPLPDDD